MARSSSTARQERLVILGHIIIKEIFWCSIVEGNHADPKRTTAADKQNDYLYACFDCLEIIFATLFDFKKWAFHEPYKKALGIATSFAYY